jgi:hypothetical protein
MGAVGVTEEIIRNCARNMGEILDRLSELKKRDLAALSIADREWYDRLLEAHPKWGYLDALVYMDEQKKALKKGRFRGTAMFDRHQVKALYGYRVATGANYWGESSWWRCWWKGSSLYYWCRGPLGNEFPIPASALHPISLGNDHQASHAYTRLKPYTKNNPPQIGDDVLYEEQEDGNCVVLGRVVRGESCEDAWLLACKS